MNSMVCNLIRINWRTLLKITHFSVQVLSNTVKQKQKEKAGKWDVPLPKVSSSCIFSWLLLLSLTSKMEQVMRLQIVSDISGRLNLL